MGVPCSGAVLDAKAGFEVLDCAVCGYAHVRPMPSERELRELYDEDYYAREKPLYLKEVAEDEPWLRLVVDARLAALEGSLPPHGPRRLLDVGSGPGTFLARGRERGWEVLGVEPSVQAAAHARDVLGLPILEAFLDEDTARDLGPFDALHLCNVLEHVPEPGRLLTLARGLLAPGGVLMAIAPNDYNPLQHALREVRGFAPWWVAPPHHLNYFTTASLPRLVEREGFEVLAVETTFPMELFLLMGDDYTRDPALGRACHGKRKRLDQALAEAGLGELRAKLQRAWAALGIGREVQVLARRRP